MEKELNNSSLPVEKTAQVLAKQSEKEADIKARATLARNFPRDEEKALKKILKECDDLEMAKEGVYKLPIKGKDQEGLSIRMSEEIKRIWTNLESGFTEISRGANKSSCEAWCWDLETNNKSVIAFEVEHFIEVGTTSKSKKHLTDPVEIGRLIANHAARRERECVLNQLPKSYIRKILKACKDRASQLEKGETLESRIKNTIAHFGKIKVTVEMIEKRLGHSIKEVTSEELGDLYGVYKSIVDKLGTVEEFFEDGAGLATNEKPPTAAAESVVIPTDAKKVNAEIVTEPKDTGSNPEFPDIPEVQKPDAQGFVQDVERPYIKTRVVQTDQFAIITAAGQTKHPCWSKFKDSQIKDIPREELENIVKNLELKIEAKSAFPAGWPELYKNACIYLSKQPKEI